jgi:hypothetical protein
LRLCVFQHSSRSALVPRRTGTVCTQGVTDLPGPSSVQTTEEKINALKRLAQKYAHDLGSCDNVQISYLEIKEEQDNDNLRLVQMLAR